MAEDIVFAPAGAITSIANPAAGAAPAVYTNNTGSRQQLISIYFQLVSSVTAANRSFVWEFARGGSVYQVAGLGALLSTTGFTYRVSIHFTGPMALVTNIAGRYWQGFGPIVLNPSDTMTWVANLDVADQLSAVIYQFAAL